MKKLAAVLVMALGIVAHAQSFKPSSFILRDASGSPFSNGSGAALSYTPPPFILYDSSGNPFPNGSGTALNYTPPAFTCYTIVTGSVVPCSFANTGVTQIVAGTGITITPSGGTGAVTINATGGAGALPTATDTGQPISSTGAGTTYTVQGQLVYQKSGDTIASIEANTQCATACTYVVTASQTITLAASHALSSTVNLKFEHGGIWTVNGAFTLTINAQITASKVQAIFAGTSTVVVNNQNTYWQWWGAVNDGAYLASPTGTDNTTAIQASVSGTQSGYCSMAGAAGFYRITAALALTSSTGLCLGDSTIVLDTEDAFTITNGLVPVLMNTSTTANSITVTGSSGHNLNSPVIQGMGIVYPNLVSSSGTATCEYDQFTQQMVIRNVTCLDAIIGFHHVVADDMQITNAGTGWGYGVATAYTSAYSALEGDFLDSSSGASSNSIQYFNVNYTVASAVQNNGQIVTGLLASGEDLNDEDIYYVGTAGVQFPIEFNYTGSGGGIAANDIHVSHATLQCGGSGTSYGIYINGLPASQDAQITLDESWVSRCTIGVYALNSSNIMLASLQLDGNGVSFEANGSTAISGTANIFLSASETDGVLITGSSGVTGTFTLNTVGSGATYTNGVHFTSTSTPNNITANCNGYGTNCVTADSTSSVNICSVSRSGGHVTNRDSGISCNEIVATPDTAAGIQTVVNGAVGANMLGTYYGAGAAVGNGMPGGCGQVVGQQYDCALNAYFNGSNWIYMSSVGGGQAAAQSALVRNGSTNAGWQLSFAPNGAAGGNVTFTTAINCTGAGTCTFGLPVNLSSTASLQFNTSAGTSGQLAVSQGAGAAPAWQSLATAGVAPVASPTFTGTPAAPTAAAGTNTTQIATTAFVLANATPLSSGGTKFTTTGCSVSSTTGGGYAGTFTLGANNCTVVITLNVATGYTAPNGWTCDAHDRTTIADLISGESSSTTTTASIVIPVTAGATDIISFKCSPF
jgi:hypothetical protein